MCMTTVSRPDLAKCNAKSPNSTAFPLTGENPDHLSITCRTQLGWKGRRLSTGPLAYGREAGSPAPGSDPLSDLNARCMTRKVEQAGFRKLPRVDLGNAHDARVYRERQQRDWSDSSGSRCPFGNSMNRISRYGRELVFLALALSTGNDQHGISETAVDPQSSIGELDKECRLKMAFIAERLEPLKQMGYETDISWAHIEESLVYLVSEDGASYLLTCQAAHHKREGAVLYPVITG